MDPTQINRLKEEYIKGLQLCEEKISLWKKFKDDYESLEERLDDFPNKLSYDITVPFGSNAFMEGKIVHTNEITVLLGDGWFADVSAKQASAIASRRIKHCVKMLEDLQKEKDQFQNWLNYIKKVSTSEDLVEIVEKFDEAEELKWREQHAENVRSYRRQLREQEQGGGGSSADTCASSSLEEEEALAAGVRRHLDLTEEESESKSVLDSEGSTFDFSDDGSALSESPGSHFFPNDDRHLMEGTKEVEECSEDHQHVPACEKHVWWQDLSKKNMQRITFKHSRNKKNHVKIPCEGAEEAPLIQSPSDIYKQFESFFPASPPKSILKVKHSPPADAPLTAPSFPGEVSDHSGSPVPIVSRKNSRTAFTGEVHEHSSPPVHTNENKKNSRPVSQFKSSRRNKKK